MKEQPDGRSEHTAGETARIDAQALAAELEARFTEVDAAQLVPLAGAPEAFLGVIRLSARRPELGAQLIDAAAEHGALLYPALFAPKEAAALDRCYASPRWSELAGAEGDLRQMERLRGAGYPRSVRRWLSRAIRRHRALLDHAQRSEQLPLHRSLALCAQAVEDAQRQLFATVGERFEPGPEAARRFDALFVKPGHFAAADGRVAAELHGLARQAALFAELCPERSFEWLEAVRRAAEFFDRCERYVARVFVSDAERRRRRVLAFAGLGAGALALLVALVVWLIATRPIAPLPDDARFARAGGIRASYFNGRMFEKHIVTRTDPNILFSTGGAPAVGLTPDNFSARWEGYLFFPQAGKQLLCSECDDGARIFFKGALIVDDWKIHGLNRTCATLRVKQGWYPLKVEYFEVSKGATMRLLRGEDERSVTVVPPAHLCCREPPPKAAPLPKAAPPAKPAPTAPPAAAVPAAPPAKAARAAQPLPARLLPPDRLPSGKALPPRPGR